MCLNFKGFSHLLGFNSPPPPPQPSSQAPSPSPASSPIREEAILVQNSKDILLQRLQDLTRSVEQAEQLSDEQISMLHILMEEMEANIAGRSPWDGDGRSDISSLEELPEFEFVEKGRPKSSHMLQDMGLDGEHGQVENVQVVPKPQMTDNWTQTGPQPQTRPAFCRRSAKEAELILKASLELNAQLDSLYKKMNKRKLEVKSHNEKIEARIQVQMQLRARSQARAVQASTSEVEVDHSSGAVQVTEAKPVDGFV